MFCIFDSQCQAKITLLNLMFLKLWRKVQTKAHYATVLKCWVNLVECFFLLCYGLLLLLLISRDWPPDSYFCHLHGWKIESQSCGLFRPFWVDCGWIIESIIRALYVTPVPLKFCVRLCEKMFATKTADKVSRMIMLT